MSYIQELMLQAFSFFPKHVTTKTPLDRLVAELSQSNMLYN